MTSDNVPNAPEAPPEPLKLFTNKAWQQCYEHFLQSIYSRSGSVRSVIDYQVICKMFFADPARTPDQYTRADVEIFLNRSTRFRGSAPMPRTRTTRLACLRSFYAWSASYTILFRGKPRPLLRALNPTVGIKAGKPDNRRRAMTDSELAKFFAVIPRTTRAGLRDRAIFLFYFYTGRRCSEVRNLRWGDLTPVTFTENGTERKGWRYRWRGKGHAGKDRSAELPAPAMLALQEYLMASGRWGHVQAADPLFISQVRSDVPMGETAIRDRFHLYCKRAGIGGDGGLVIHSFRYTAARARYLENGRDIMQVRADLDHASVLTTQHYLERGMIQEEGDSTALRLAAKWSGL